MRKPSEVIGESLTLYARQDSQNLDRQFMCTIVRDHFPKEREQVCKLISESISGHCTLIGYLVAKDENYPYEDESLAFEYRRKWWQDLIAKLEAEGQ